MLTPKQVMRLERFRKKHPDIDIGKEFGEWCATLRLPDDDVYDIGHLHSPDLRDLLDELDELLDRPG